MKYTCPKCDGSGLEEEIFSCCGDDITGNDIDIYPSCLEHCGMEAEDCDECGGSGELDYEHYWQVKNNYEKPSNTWLVKAVIKAKKNIK